MSRTSDRTYLRKRRRIRNQDVCWLCGQWINPEYKTPHPLSWSADHVVPVANGGNNHGELKPAHRVCNARRGNRKPQRADTHGRKW